MHLNLSICMIWSRSQHAIAQFKMPIPQEWPKPSSSPVQFIETWHCASKEALDRKRPHKNVTARLRFGHILQPLFPMQGIQPATGILSTSSRKGIRRPQKYESILSMYSVFPFSKSRVFEILLYGGRRSENRYKYQQDRGGHYVYVGSAARVKFIRMLGER